MKDEDRRAAVAAYKERKVVPGIYRFHCVATGQDWIGAAPDLATIENRLSFTLRQKGHRSASLQAAWNAHGAEGVIFDVVERFDAEELPYARDSLLRDRLLHWSQELRAEPI